MKKYTIDELKAEFAKHNYKWFDDINFVGIRSKANLPNQFDDLFGVIQNGKITWYTCTTNPGTHWLKNILNPKGAALLKAAQYLDTWKTLASNRSSILGVLIAVPLSPEIEGLTKHPLSVPASSSRMHEQRRFPLVV